MKTSSTILFLTCTLFACSLTAGTTELKLKQNGQIDFSEYRGKVVYLDFWASWCIPCREAFPWMNDLNEQYDDDELVIIAVNLDTERADAETFLEQVPANFEIAYDPDGKTARAYELKGMPTSLLIDQRGKIAMTKIGFKYSETRKVESKIRELVR